MSRLLANVFQPIKLVGQSLQTLIQSTTNSSVVKPDSFLLSMVRTKVRCYFPRPNEVRRVRRHGWATRISTSSGRKVIMRRMLKGRLVLSH